MVGGYVILSRVPLEVGKNDMASIYGNKDAANGRLFDIAYSKKPALAYIKVLDTAVAVWFETAEAGFTTVKLNSNMYTIEYDLGTAIMTVAKKEE